MNNTELIVKLLSVKGIGRKIALDFLGFIDFNILNDNELAEFIISKSPSIKRFKGDENLIWEGIIKGKSILSNSELAEITLVDFKSDKYPKSLLKTNDFPLILSCRGNIELLNQKSIAIIGTRKPTDYGFKIGQKLAEFFTHKEYKIVSGLALGCDTAAHLGCLESNGETVGVLAHGLHMIYPKVNIELANRILSNNGLLISEYFIGQPPLANYFVARDRIQAGLSDAVFVIETGIKGGSLHTVGFAEKYKRPVYCFNHPEKYRNNEHVAGNQMLINSGQVYPFFDQTDLNRIEGDLSKKREDTCKDNMIRSDKDCSNLNVQGKLWQE